MRLMYVLLLISTALLATNGCFSGDTHLCHSGHPLFVGGRIQPLVRRGELPDPFWNNEGRRFVFLRPPGKNPLHWRFNGRRGVIRIGERTCSGRNDVHCPVPTSDIPCGFHDFDVAGSAPLVFSDLTSTSVNVSWANLHRFASQRDPAINWYILRYRKAVETSSVFDEITVSEAPTRTIPDLEPDTLYEFQLVPMSDDVAEVIEPTRIQTVRTLCGVPPTPSFSKIATTSRSATFSVNIPGPEEWKCSDMTAILQVQVDDSWVDLTTLDQSDTTAVVEDLTPCSSYSFRLKVSNIHETSFTEVQDIDTKPEGHTGVIQPTGESIVPGTMNVSWIPPDMSDTACDVSRYVIQYAFIRYKACPEDDHPVDTEVPVIHRVEVSGTETSVELNDLKHFADYNISITPLVDDQDGPVNGETVSFVESTATADPVGVPDRIILSGVSGSHLTFSWDAPALCESWNGILTGYSYILEDNSVVVSTGTTDTNSVKIDYLSPDTEYTFRVAAMTTAGPGPYSEKISEATRYTGCREKSTLRLGGTLTSLSEDRPPWGSGQPVFITPHHLLFRKGRHFGRPFGHGGIIKIWRSDRAPYCKGSSRAGNCPADPETPREIPGFCSEMDSPDYSCEATFPRFSYEQGDVISFERLSLRDVKVTWRDWEVTKDKGFGQVTGYLLRYRRRGEVIKEIYKGLSLHHSFFDLAVNAYYEFEVVALTEGRRGDLAQYKTMDTPLPALYVTGCGELDPVQNIEVVTNNERGTLIVSWDPPPSFCPIVRYEYSMDLVAFKACLDSPFESFSTELYGDRPATNETTLVLTEEWGSPLLDFADYNITVTPISEMVDEEEGIFEERPGETTSIIGSTIEHVPFRTPSPSAHKEPTSAVISWNHLECWELRGIFTGYTYYFHQDEGLEINGTTIGTSVEFEDLLAYTNFTFHLQIHTSGGSGPIETIFDRTASSTELFYQNQTSVLEIENITSSSVTLSWPEWNEFTGNGTGTVQNYTILYRPYDGEQNGANAGLNLSTTIDGLQFDKEYHFRILIIGRGPYGGKYGIASDVQIVQTHCRAPTKPALRLIRKPKAGNPAILETGIPAGAEGWGCRDTDKVNAYLQTTEEGEWVDEETLPLSGRYHQIHNLTRCTNVTYRIKTINTHYTVYSEPTSFPTYGELGPVRALTVTPTDETGELYVQWEEPQRINDCQIASYYVEYYRLGKKACDSNIRERVGNESVWETSTTITNLEPYSNYFVRVFPELASYEGEIPEMVVGVGLTKTEVPSDTVTPWVAIRKREMQFTWEEMPCEYHNGPNLTYLCELYLTNSGRPVLEESQVVTSETCTFKDLKACGNYSFVVTPGNNAGLGIASTELTARILATAGTMGYVENITAIARPHGVVNLRWERDEINNLCPASGYRIGYVLQKRQACKACVDILQLPLQTNGSSYTLHNLESFATYKVNISLALDEEGTVLEKIFTTMSSAPSEAPVARLDDTLTTANSLTFKWNFINCSSLHGVFKQYTFRSNAVNGEIGIPNRRRRSKKLRNLQPCTTYDFQVRVVNNMGRGPYSTPVFGTTALGKPGSGFDLQYELLTNGKVLLKWQGTTDNPCPIDSFIVGALLTDDHCGLLRNEPRVETNVSRDTASILLEEILASGGKTPKALSKYAVTLRARNSAGDGDDDFLEVFTTEWEPSGAPVDIYPDDMTSVSVKMTWGEVPCSQRGGDIVRYMYIYTKDGVSKSDFTPYRQVTVEGLEPDSTYSFRVRAETAVGFGPFSKKVDMITLPDQ